MSCPTSYKRFDHYPINIVREYNKVQGTTHPSDLSGQIIRDINVRYITLQNTLSQKVAFIIKNSEQLESAESLSGDWFVIEGSQTLHLAINPHGSTAQYLLLADPTIQTPKIMSNAIYLRSNANDFVIRGGINRWWVDFFARPSLYPSK